MIDDMRRPGLNKSSSRLEFDTLIKQQGYPYPQDIKAMDAFKTFRSIQDEQAGTSSYYIPYVDLANLPLH